MADFADINQQLIEAVRPGMAPQLRVGEEIVLSGIAGTPVPWWSYLLLGSIRNMMRNNRTYRVIITNQRVILAKGSAWTNKITAENFKIKHEIAIADIRDLVQAGDKIDITTGSEVLKLRAVQQLIIFGTHADFIPAVFAYLKAEVLKREQAQAAALA